jgi:hypothetical protein
VTSSGGLDIEKVLASVRPKTTTVRVCLRGDLLAQYEELERDLAEAIWLDMSENRHAEAPVIAAKVTALQEQIKTAEVEFTFTAIGQQAWTDLIVQHPAREQDTDVGLDFDASTFPMAAVAATCTNPVMTLAQAHTLYERLNGGQWGELWQGCLRANVAGADVPFSLAASAILRGSETKPEPPTS